MLSQMGLARKSNDAAIAGALCGLTAFGVLGWMCLPGFRASIILILVTTVGLMLLSLVGWLAYTSWRPKPALSLFGAGAGHQNYRTVTAPNPAPASAGSPFQSQSARPVPDPALSEKLSRIDWFQFQRLIELIYRHRAYTVHRLGGAKPDGTVDLIVKSATEDFIIECKPWRKQIVGAKEMRQFFGALVETRITTGIIITLVAFSREAKDMADRHKIQILYETDLIQMLVESGLADTREISSILSDDHKYCPKCEHQMVLRKSRFGENQFWGCSDHPRCRFTLNVES
jgi:restriction system protein